MTIREIAHLTGLSTATVSHVINKTRHVSPQSREKVMRAIGQTGYMPSMAARMLRTQRSNVVALILPQIDAHRPSSLFFADLLTGVQEYLDQNGYLLLTAWYDERRPDGVAALEVLKRQWIDGVILVPGCLNCRDAEWLLSAGIPFALLDRRIDGAAAPGVSSDNRGGAFEACKLLLASGARRIGFLAGDCGVSTFFDRRSGYLEAKKKFCYQAEDGLCLSELDCSAQAGFQAAETLIRRGADAILACDGALGIGVLRYLRQLGLHVGQDISLIVFDDHPWMDAVFPPITRVRQEARSMGSQAARLLLARISDPVFNENVLLPISLIKGETHQKIK